MKYVVILVCIAVLGAAVGVGLAWSTGGNGLNSRICISAIGPVDQNGQGNNEGNLKCEERP